MKCEMCIHYGICVVNSYCHEPCGYYEEERSHGEWIEHRTQDCFGFFHSEYECSKCHNEVWQKTEWQFCPKCGADMREEGDRND